MSNVDDELNSKIMVDDVLFDKEDFFEFGELVYDWRYLFQQRFD